MSVTMSFAQHERKGGGGDSRSKVMSMTVSFCIVREERGGSRTDGRKELYKH